MTSKEKVTPTLQDFLLTKEQEQNHMEAHHYYKDRFIKLFMVAHDNNEELIAKIKRQQEEINILLFFLLVFCTCLVFAVR